MHTHFQYHLLNRSIHTLLIIWCLVIWCNLTGLKVMKKVPKNQHTYITLRFNFINFLLWFDLEIHWISILQSYLSYLVIYVYIYVRQRDCYNYIVVYIYFSLNLVTLVFKTPHPSCLHIYPIKYIIICICEGIVGGLRFGSGFNPETSA